MGLLRIGLLGKPENPPSVLHVPAQLVGHALYHDEFRRILLSQFISHSLEPGGEPWQTGNGKLHVPLRLLCSGKEVQLVVIVSYQLTRSIDQAHLQSGPRCLPQTWHIEDRGADLRELCSLRRDAFERPSDLGP